MDFAEFLSELNIALGDTDNFTFTTEEKTRALTEAINDPYTVKPIWDTSLTYSVGTYQYGIPTGMTTVKDIYIRTDNSVNNPTKIDSSFWEVIGTNIQFSPLTNIPDTYGLYLSGNYKYTISDTITETNTQEYVLTLAQFRCLKLLGNKKVNRFLKNDTTMSELVTLKRDLEQDVINYRKRLPTSYQVA